MLKTACIQLVINSFPWNYFFKFGELVNIFFTDICLSPHLSRKDFCQWLKNTKVKTEMVAQLHFFLNSEKKKVLRFWK